MPNDKRDPTPRQVDICRAVDRLTKRDGFAPTLIELAAELEVCLARAHNLAEGARDRGALQWIAGKARTYRVTDRGILRRGRGGA